MTRREKRQLTLLASTVLGIAGIAASSFLAYRLWIRRRPAGLHAFDASFIRNAMELIADGSELGRAVGVHAADQHVQELAQRIVEHHSEALNNLEDIATYLGLAVSSEPSRQTRRLAKRLAKMAGPEVDRLFLEAIIEDHEEALQIAQQAQDLAEQPELQAFADTLCDTLRDHLESARRRREQLQQPTGART